MPDNVNITPGSGASIAADLCTVNSVSTLVPLGKVGFGANDSWTYVTSSAGLPVAQQGTWTVQPGNTANTTPWLVNVRPATSGGLTPYSYIAAGSANQDSQVVKGSAGQVYALQLSNAVATVRYVKIYDKATGPTSADTPVKRLMVPGGGGSNIVLAGVAFASGIAIRITTGGTDADTGAATSGDVLVNIDYA